MFCARLLVACLFLSTFTFGQTPTFTKLRFNTGVNFPNQLVVADFNGDGIADVVGFDAANQMFIQLGNGDGTFQAERKTGFGDTPLAVGDINGDGKQDIVGVSHVYFGNGNGTFSQGYLIANVPPHQPGYAAVVADFNRDGKLDVAMASRDQSGARTVDHVDIFLNNGAGFTFKGTADTIADSVDKFGNWTVGSIDDFLIGDFDADGKADIAIRKTQYDPYGSPNGGTDIHALYGNGDGTFAIKALPRYDSYRSVTSTDINQDGLSDLTGVQWAAGSVNTELVVFRSGAGRTFTGTVYPLASGGLVPRFPAAADLNGDGRIDIAYAMTNSASDYGVAVATQNPDGTFTNSSITFLDNFPGYRGQRQQLAYLQAVNSNHDTRPDLVGLFPDTKTLWSLVNTTSGGSFVPGCVAPSHGIRVCSPAPAVATSSPVRFSLSAADFSPIRKMEIWVDGTKKLETYFSYWDVSYLERSLTLPNGTHSFTAFAAGYDNRLLSTRWTVQVGGGTGCSQPASSTATHLCSPLNGSTVASPVAVSARGGSAITFMELWIDGVKRQQNAGNSLNGSFALAVGSHRLTVFSKQGSAVASRADSSFSVR